MATNKKPSYLGLINGISVAERGGGEVLTAWAKATPDAKLRKVLELVAARETNHHDVFKARVEELGFKLKEAPPNPGLEKAIDFYGSAAPDTKKLERSRSATNGDVDVLAPLVERLSDPDVDPVTCALLTWFVGEERDSGKRLRRAYASAYARAVQTA